MELYDKKFVYFEWDDILEGKKCFLANNPSDLKMNVNCGCTNRYGEVEQKSDENFPFRLKNSKSWDSEGCFVYYDPNYEVKIAFNEDKSIEFKKNDLWFECEDYPEWDRYEWRIKPTETWKVIFAEDTFLRVSMITNLSNIVFFSGTYEECGKWINEHKVYAEILSAYRHGKVIQFKMKTRDSNWYDWVFEEYPCTDSFEKCDWRIKPTEEEYYLSINKNDSYLEFTILQNITNDTVYNGTRKECERMMKIIGNEFKEENLSHWNISHRLRYIIIKYSHEKYTRRMTNRELAEYLAKGNGEMKKVGFDINISISYCYKNNTENENVDDNILIRDFGSDEWRPPLIEV